MSHAKPPRGLEAVRALGANSLLTYVLPVAFKIGILMRLKLKGEPLLEGLLSLLAQTVGPLWAGWAFTLGYIGLWWGVMYLLYRRGIFLKV